MNVDDIVLKLSKHGLDNLHPSIALGDRRILKSISKILVSDEYITESQANLVVKILKVNLEHLDFLGPELIDILKNPTWQKEFKILEVVKQVSIIQAQNKEFMIDVTFSYDRDIVKVLKNLEKIAYIDKKSNEAKQTLFALEEKTLVNIYEALTPLNFEFSQDFLELLEKIKNIDTQAAREKILFENLYQTKIKKFIDEDAVNDELLILDRKIGYQYDFLTEFEENTKSTLTYKIANRAINKIFIDKNKIDLLEIIQSLKVLKRNKILFVFDEYKPTDCIDGLNNIKSVSNQLGTTEVGIYFRFNNKNHGIVFNKLIADCNFNNRLSNKTDIVGISNGKVPKFMLKTDWYPDAVISLTNHFRNNRSQVYCNDCDLIVYYTDILPLSAKAHAIL
jgi:hypothetical protein